MISIGVCPWMMDTDGIEAVQRASELGFTAIEIGVFNIEGYEKMRDPAVQNTYLEAASAHGIELVGISLNIFTQIVTLYSEEQEATVWEVMRNVIDAALAMNIELVCCGMFGDFSIHNADEMARTSAMLRRGCDYIGNRPLRIATENTLSIEDNRKLIEQVNHPNMRVLVDCYNGIWSGAFNGAEMVRDLSDMLCNVVHAKDGPDDALIGQGNGDFLTTAQALKDIGFEGYVMCENNYRNDTEARTAADLATLKRMFKDMH